ncbi:hypothetical protein F4553_005738 [Allocatelliglobosispora scoriae]|uniref:Toxin-antitoxin system HicB family antitoxin n=1 Tax=Allocatelliglobosispora scoriae TaxID=643052 RepID=A0A841BVV8_9ACTN|nr:YlcI/YnfO family protein [Allocatelliglobosispora scoriae]MBB5872304.1 hypothetical protein [Allocatelliglobosispora scoriae]
MELSPYLESLQRDLEAAAAPGGEQIIRAAELLAGSLDASARLCLLEALSDAAAEITSKLSNTSVDVRLRGRDADFVVIEAPVTEQSSEQPAPAAIPDGAEQTRITLRLPEPLKEAVERAAAAEGVSTNAWLVRAIAGAVRPATIHPSSRAGNRITGFAQA